MLPGNWTSCYQTKLSADNDKLDKTNRNKTNKQKSEGNGKLKNK